MKSDTNLVSITVPADWWAAATRLASQDLGTRRGSLRANEHSIDD